MKIKGVEMGDIADLAKKAHKALVNQNTFVKKSELEEKEIKRIRRAMKKEGYKGNMFFYICKKVHEAYLGNLEMEMESLRKHAPEVYEEKSESTIQGMMEDLSEYVRFCIEFDMLISKYKI